MRNGSIVAQMRVFVMNRETDEQINFGMGNATEFGDFGAMFDAACTTCTFGVVFPSVQAAYNGGAREPSCR